MLQEQGRRGTGWCGMDEPVSPGYLSTAGGWVGGTAGPLPMGCMPRAAPAPHQPGTTAGQGSVPLLWPGSLWTSAGCKEHE